MLLKKFQMAGDEGQSFLRPLQQPQLSATDDLRTSMSAKSDSYSNLYEQDLPLGGSAHSLRNQLIGQGSPRPVHGGRGIPLSSKQGPYSAYAAGGNVPLNSPRDPCSPPPPYDCSPRGGPRPVPHHQVGSPLAASRGPLPQQLTSRGATVLASDEKYPMLSDRISRSPPPSLSANNPTRTAPMGMPRYGSPTFPPSSQQPHHDALPLSVAAAGVQNVPGAVRRPMSFVRALETSDQLAGSGGAANTRQQRPFQVTAGGGRSALQVTVEEDERAQFGSNYEIAV